MKTKYLLQQLVVRYSGTALVLFTISCMAGPTAQADLDSAESDLSRIIGYVAKTRQQFLADEGQDSIALGAIINQTMTSAGTKVAQILEKKLSSGKNPLKIKPKVHPGSLWVTA